MPDILVRDIDPNVVDRLRERARRHDRSLQSELKAILERASREGIPEARRLAQHIRRKLSGRTHTDSALLQAKHRSR